MHTIKTLIKPIILVFLLFLGCKSQKNDQIATKDNMQESEKLQLVLTDNYGGTDTPELLVIREAGALKRFFGKINMTRKPGIPVPKIDFSTKVAVIYCSGKMNGDNCPSIYTLEETDKMIVLAQKEGNLKEISTSSALIVPFALYTMPITEKEITLKPRK